MKQFSKLALAAVVGLAMLSGVASAATQGVYAGIGAGYSRQETPSSFDVGSASLTKKIGGLGGQAFAGYNFNQNFGIEAGYAYYAQSKYTAKVPGTTGTLKYNMNTADIVGKAYLPLGDNGFNVYGLGGAAYVVSKGTGAINGAVNGRATQTTKAVRPKVGLGVSYDIPNSHVTTAVEASRIIGRGNMKTDSKAIPSADMVSFNLIYNFG